MCNRYLGLLMLTIKNLPSNACKKSAIPKKKGCNDVSKHCYFAYIVLYPLQAS